LTGHNSAQARAQDVSEMLEWNYIPKSLTDVALFLLEAKVNAYCLGESPAK